MKRILLFLSATALLLALVGCGNGNGGASSGSGSTGSASGSSASSSVTAQDETVDFQLTGYDCQLTFPGSLSGTYDTAVYSDGSGVSIRSTENQAYGGTVFAIWLVTDEQAQTPGYFDNCDGTPVPLSHDTEKQVSFYLVHPYTDVQFASDDDTLTAEYQAILDAEGTISKSFTWKVNNAAGPKADWAPAYATVLQSEQDAFPEFMEVLSYSLYDMNNDNIPELFIMGGTSEADFVYSVYTYQANQTTAVPVGDFGGGHVLLCGLNGNGVLVQYTNQGEEILTRYTLADNALSGGEELSKTSDGNYHDFTLLTAYELDDISGLYWTGNPTDDNQSIVDSLAA